jgi:type I restriction enzyme R subunit
MTDSRRMSEKQTREDLINKELKKIGWLTKYVKEEVNSVRSNFKDKDYILSQGKNDDSGRFIDYLLLAEDSSPIAFVEAKRFSKSENNGRLQARTYREDIRKQIGESLPYFLTNGHKWLYVDQDSIERPVSGPFSQPDLTRRNEMYRMRTDPTIIPVEQIVSRPRSIRIVKQMMEHIREGHRSALISMATGTGKTRVGMAIISSLIKANIVRNVLFIADRIPLADQAKSKGFKQFFSEPVIDLRDDPESLPNGLYVSTLQTLRSGGQKKYFEQNFSPGFFDLIIFDEAHRSIYDPNRLVYRYFDAIKIGLTATPSRAEKKNTFELFECDGDKATVEYSYDEAIRDGILVPYRAEVIDTQVLSLGIEGKKLTKELKTALRKQELDPENTSLPGGSFARVFMDDKTNELVVREFLHRCYRSDEGKPAKAIFFCVSVKHAEHIKHLFNKLAPSLSNIVQVIVSDYYRYTDELARFKLNPEPRIALSVGVLDTGVDVPEICNLVFVRPVFSSIRFWQMVGRGTRNQDSCEYLDWLPNREKKDFLILDFAIGGHSNVKYHNLQAAKEGKAGTDVLTKIFLNRVELLKKRLDPKQKEFIENKIIADIESLNKDSFIVREKLPVIKKVTLQRFDLKNYIEELKKDIAPLISLNPAGSSLVSSFILQVEKLFGYILDNKEDKILEVSDYVREMMENILQKDNIMEVQEKKDDIMKVFEDAFWDSITFEDVEFILRELAPIMVYYEKNPTKTYQIDAPDLVRKVERFQHEIKEDEELKKFIESNSIIKKLKEGKGITSEELLEFENQISAIKPEITIDNIQRIQKIDFLIFLRKIIGLTHDYDPQVIIEHEFDTHIIEKNQNYTSEQIGVLQMLKKVFARTKHIELKDFTVPPLANERAVEKFSPSELEKIVADCRRIKIY